MATGIIYGGLPLGSTLRYGAASISRIYYGDTLVWPFNTVLAEHGAFALSGLDATLRATRRLAAEPGAFNLAGYETGAGLTVVGEAGTYALTGQQATLIAALKAFASAGTFTLTGQDAVLRRQVLSAVAGSFTLAGQDVGLMATRTLPAEAGAFSLSVFGAGGVKGYLMSAEAGAYTLSGNNAELVRRVLAANAGSFSVAGQAALLTRQKRLTAEAGAFALVGQSAELDYVSTVTSFTLVGSATGTDTSIEISAIGSLQDGDLCLIWNAGDGGSSTPDTTPAGFTQLCTFGFGRRATISAKKLDGTETTVTGISASGIRWICAVFRPNAPWTSFTDHNTGNYADFPDPSGQLIDALTDGATGPLVMYGQMYSNATISPRNASGMAEIAGAASNHYGHYRLIAAGDARVDQSYDMDDEGTNFMQSGYLTFT